VQLVYVEEAASRGTATQREGRIKRLSRARKMMLIQDGTSPQ
jgi:predicted GIY-YIG superfamily endonuclease